MKLKKWALIAEIVAGFAVIISLILIMVEVRGNTRAVERQIASDHHRSIFSPFISPQILVSALQKIKAVGGHEDYVRAFMATYDMTEAEADVWENFQRILWVEMQYDFVNNGPSDRLA